MTPFLTRNDSNQKTACARSVRVCPNACCRVFKSTSYQVSVSNTVTEATTFRLCMPRSDSFQPRSTAELIATLLLPHVLLHTALPLHLRERRRCCPSCSNAPVVLLRVSEPRPVSLHHIFLRHIQRLIEPFEFAVCRQELGQTHHSHPVEFRRLSISTPHCFRRTLAIRSVQDDVSDQSHH